MIEMIIFMVLWLNAFPPDSGTHQIYSPRKTIMDRNLDYIKNCRVEFWTSAETYDDATPTNTVAELSTEDILLGATKNFQHRYKFLSLRTGHIITRKSSHHCPCHNL